MSYADNPYSATPWVSAAEAAENERAGFIVKTYAHLMGAVIAFVLLEGILLSLPITENLVGLMIGGRFSWLIVLGMFIGVSMLAEKWAQSATSLSTQYLGLGLYVFAEAVVFLPILFIASHLGGPDAMVIPTAGIATVSIFGVLSAIVFITRANFSFLRGVLWFGGLAALALIVCSMVFSFPLGQIFTVAMIGFAGVSILYQTSNVLHQYRIGQHVAASLALFASVALLFWYVLRLFMSSRD